MLYVIFTTFSLPVKMLVSGSSGCFQLCRVGQEGPSAIYGSDTSESFFEWQEKLDSCGAFSYVGV